MNLLIASKIFQIKFKSSKERFKQASDEAEKNKQKYLDVKVKVPLAVFGKKLFGKALDIDLLISKFI